MSENKLFRFYWDCGRMGSLEGLFVAAQDSVDYVLNKVICFGEVLGKHSYVEATLETKDLEVVSEDFEKVEWLKSIMGHTLSGYNPLQYWIERALDESEEDIEDWPASLISLAKEMEPWYFE